MPQLSQVDSNHAGSEEDLARVGEETAQLDPGRKQEAQVTQCSPAESAAFENQIQSKSARFNCGCCAERDGN